MAIQPFTVGVGLWIDLNLDVMMFGICTYCVFTLYTAYVRNVNMFYCFKNKF